MTTVQTIRYRAGRRIFKTIEAACEYADQVFRATGIVIAIEVVKGKDR